MGRFRPMSYVRGLWGGFGASGTLPPGLAANLGVVGITVTRNWSEIETSSGVYFWDDLDNDITEAKAAGFTHINLGITNSTNDLPAWLLTLIKADGTYIDLRDPGQNHSTFCDPISTPLYWGTRFQAARLALIAAAGAKYNSDPMIHAVACSFCNHNSGDWNVQDTVGELSGMGCTGGPYFVDQPSQWNGAGWTRALMLQVGKDICDAVAVAFPSKNLKLPIGGLHDELAIFTRPATGAIGSPNITMPSAGFITGDVGQEIIAIKFTAPSTYTQCFPAGTTILSRTDASHVVCSANATAVPDRVRLPGRNPDPRGSVAPNYSTLAAEILAYVAGRPYASRFYPQRNTVDTTWGTPQDLIDNPPGFGSERYIKKIIADAAPLSGLQTVSRATDSAHDNPPYRQNGNKPGTDIQIMQDSLTLMLSYKNSFIEIWPQDSQNPLFYTMIAAATIAMGGQTRGQKTGVLVLPSKRFGDDPEDLTIADLNDLTPVMQLDEESVGATELITEDVVAILSESMLGVRQDYVFPVNYVLPNVQNTNIIVATVAFPNVQFGDPIKVSLPRDPVTDLVADLNVEFTAVARVQLGTVDLYASGLVASTTIPAGTTVTLIAFTSTFIPHGPQQSQQLLLTGAPAATDTGFLDVAPGYDWKPGEAITTQKLDATCQPTAGVKPASIGRRELDPNIVRAIAAPIIGGLDFGGFTPNKFTILVGDFAEFGLAFPGALAGDIAVVSRPLGALNTEWGAQVLVDDSIIVFVWNLSNATVVVPTRTVFRGKLL